ncbi:MAG: sigma54 specific transcriptional regulator, Fis family, partial [Clostridiales bacterium]|nr:sigma54 specific transcriptional regulator, Fis family [Clostridiales bacterium]
EIKGNVVTFQDITKIQEAEGKIRNKIYLRGHIAKYTFDDVMGKSQKIKDVIGMAKHFASVSSNILISGETGTGKELFAQSIHNASDRKNGPFVAVNCAALPENLLESELFGYVEGAFTGAAKSGKLGMFELAHKGTIFLDEVSELPPKLQGRLLRVIQERSIMRLGDDKIISVDVRIIAATNKNLKVLSEKGEFRNDLYFRLNVLKLDLPSLREHPEDIPFLIEKNIERYAKILGKEKLIFTEKGMELLLNYTWPGNIRELQNICERLLVLSMTAAISCKEVEFAFSDKDIKIEKSVYTPDKMMDMRPQALEHSSGKLKDKISDMERQKITEALDMFHGNKVKTARYLGISRNTLWRRIKEMNL